MLELRGNVPAALVALLAFQYYPQAMAKHRAWLVIILLVAAYFRLHGLNDVPPGLTHDEADHGLDAWGVVNGERPIYFTVGYGREPLYDYSTAGLMAFLGPTSMAGRLTSAYFSLLLIAGVYAWVRAGFDFRVATLTAAGLAVGFWPVMTGRQALRSIALPAVMVLGFVFFWRAITLVPARHRTIRRPLQNLWSSPTANFLIAGSLLGLSFYTYIPARILWLIFPATLLFLALCSFPWLWSIRTGVILFFLTASLLALPLFLFLNDHPQAEARLDQLNEPLRQAMEGEIGPLLNNAIKGLGMIAFTGDSQWRYNVPGRPLLSPAMALLFFVGLMIALWRLGRWTRLRQPDDGIMATFVALCWLLLGLSPALVTGADLSTPRVIGVQPVLYLFPALALARSVDVLRPPGNVWLVAMTLLFAAVAFQTHRTYFQRWANEPEVRVQYESALVTTLGYLDGAGYESVAISTTTPNRFHSPAVALLTFDNPDVKLRWFDGRMSLLVPMGERSAVVFSGFAPLNSLMQKYFLAGSSFDLPVREADLDRPITVYEIDGLALSRRWMAEASGLFVAPPEAQPPVQFGQVAELLGYELLTSQVAPGQEVSLATFWRALEPVGEVVLFTQVIGPNGLPLAQADRLDVPSLYWVRGDVFLQLHQFSLPAAMTPGDYPLLIGMYTRDDSQRIPVHVQGKPVADHLRLPPLKVQP